jgi:hypothetical protein
MQAVVKLNHAAQSGNAALEFVGLAPRATADVIRIEFRWWVVPHLEHGTIGFPLLQFHLFQFGPVKPHAPAAAIAHVNRDRANPGLAE